MLPLHLLSENVDPQKVASSLMSLIFEDSYAVKELFASKVSMTTSFLFHTWQTNKKETTHLPVQRKY